MMPQTDYTNRIENNAGSQQILENNKVRINHQCTIVLQALQRGERLTTALALIKYGVGDLRRRCKDLKDIHHIKIKDRLVEGRYKEWFIETVKN